MSTTPIDVGQLLDPAGGSQSTDYLTLVRTGPQTDVFRLPLAAALAALAQSLPTTPQAPGIAWLNQGFICVGPATLVVSGGGGGGPTNHVLLRDGSSRVLCRDGSFLTHR
jgi:hypothetical protein